MSTFSGLVEEIPGISVDRFDGENLRSSVFFLSHCHTDHMHGLNESFFRRLMAEKQFLHCTLLTKLFLSGRFDLDDETSETIKVVVPCSPIIVNWKTNGETISATVVSVNAGHCPGSVMFIFELNNRSILYTGDFRIDPKDLPKLKPLHDIHGFVSVPKKFEKIYLDTTFFNSNYQRFPTRRQSMSEIIGAIGDWISRDSKNVVVIECSAVYGSEFLFMEIRERLKLRVHVKTCVCKDFSRICELERCITDDGRSTPIHACASKRKKSRLECRNVDAKNILTIVPSAFRWKSRDLSGSISEWDNNDDKRFYVCLSMHSSYDELKAFVDYFEGAKFFACVQPKNYGGCVQDELNEMTKKHVDREVRTSFKTYDFESLKRKRSELPRVKSRYFSDDSSD